MRLVHTADLHLGHGRYNRTDKTGRNIRELDVTASFRALIDQVIAIAPDVMIIAGDVLDSVRPKNPVVIDAFTEFRRLTEALPRLVIVMVAGNHDFPRSEETGCLLPLFRQLGITVVDREAQKIVFPELSLNVLAVPDTPVMIRPAFQPDPDCRFNIAVLHGEVEGMSGLLQERALKSYRQGDVVPASWDYIGLGHYHVYQQLAPNMFYSGAIDYVSTNVWGELADEKKFGVDGKGFVERDLVTGEHTFHRLPKTRDHIDLALDATGMTAEQLNTALDELLDDAWPDMTIARVVITGCPKSVQKAVSSKKLRTFKARALNLMPIFRPIEVREYGEQSPIPSRRHIASLPDLLRDAMLKRQANGDWPADVSLEACYNLGKKGLDEVEHQFSEKVRSIEPVDAVEDPVAA